MRHALLLWLCLVLVAAAADTTPQVSVKDILFREDNYVNYPGSPDYDPYLQPTVRVSVTLRNDGKVKARKLKARMSWGSLDGTVLRKEVEVLPELPPGRDVLYWAPPFYNPGRALVRFQIEVLDGDQVIATRNEHQ